MVKMAVNWSVTLQYVRTKEVKSVARGWNWLKMGAVKMCITLRHEISGYITMQPVSSVDSL